MDLDVIGGGKNRTAEVFYVYTAMSRAATCSKVLGDRFRALRWGKYHARCYNRGTIHMTTRSASKTYQKQRIRAVGGIEAAQKKNRLHLFFVL